MTSPRSAPLPCGAPLIEGGVLIARCDQPPHHPGITQRTPSGGTVVSFVGQHGNTDGVPIFWTDQPRQVEP